MGQKNGVKLLKYSSLILLILSIINILQYFMINMSLMSLAREGKLELASLAYWALALVSIFTMFLAGNTGFKNWNNPAAADKCIKLGIINLAVVMVVRIMNVLIQPTEGQIAGIFVGAIIPILYLVGANKLAKLPKEDYMSYVDAYDDPDEDYISYADADDDYDALDEDLTVLPEEDPASHVDAVDE